MEEIKIQQFAEKLELLGYSKRCLADYPAYMRLFFNYLEQKENLKTAAEIRPEHISAYHAYLQYNRLKKNSYLSTATVSVRLNIVKTFFRVMYEEKLLPQNYALNLILPKRRQALPRHVPNEHEMKTLLDTVVTADPVATRDRALLELLYSTGIRSEEVRSIRLEQCDLDGKTLFINGKGSKDRIVPVGRWVVPYLREYLECARPKLVNRREATDLLFLSKNGRMITGCNLNDLIRKYCKRAGLEKRITPHSFRHACATHLLQNGADIRYVQELLGHADLSSTQIYTKIDISFLRKAHGRYHPRESGE
jgi:integrase/recombinase XerD